MGLMGQYQQQSGRQYNQYSGQYNVPGGQASGGNHHDDEDDHDEHDDHHDDAHAMMMMMTGESHKVERGSELRHIFSPGPNSNQQMVRSIVMMIMMMIIILVLHIDDDEDGTSSVMGLEQLIFSSLS